MVENKNVSQAEHKGRASPTKSLISGGFGGICTVITGHPFDTIKFRLQTMPVPAPGQPPLYTGALDCAKKMIKLEGVKGLYKGMSAPLASTAPVFAISFWAYRQGTLLLAVEEKEELGLARTYLAGSFAGIFTSFVMAPAERIKVLLQNQHGQAMPKYKGPVDVVKQLYRDGGIRSLFKGTSTTLLREVPASGMYFMTYEWFRKVLQPIGGDDYSTQTIKTIIAGGMAGVAYWPVGMPADVVKSRFQSAPEGTYEGIPQVFKVLLKEGGPAAFYKGMVPVMLRAFPANAACFVGVEACTLLLHVIAPNL